MRELSDEQCRILAMKSTHRILAIIDPFIAPKNKGDVILALQEAFYNNRMELRKNEKFKF